MSKYEREYQFLETFVRDHPEGMDIILNSWNDAVSLQASLKRALREIESSYNETGIDNPFKSITITHVRPATVRLRRGQTELVVHKDLGIRPAPKLEHD